MNNVLTVGHAIAVQEKLVCSRQDHTTQLQDDALVTTGSQITGIKAQDDVTKLRAAVPSRAGLEESLSAPATVAEDDSSSSSHGHVALAERDAQKLTVPPTAARMAEHACTVVDADRTIAELNATSKASRAVHKARVQYADRGTHYSQQAQSHVENPSSDNASLQPAEKAAQTAAQETDIVSQCTDDKEERPCGKAQPMANASNEDNQLGAGMLGSAAVQWLPQSLRSLLRELIERVLATLGAPKAMVPWRRGSSASYMQAMAVQS